MPDVRGRAVFVYAISVFDRIRLRLV